MIPLSHAPILASGMFVESVIDNGKSLFKSNNFFGSEEENASSHNDDFGIEGESETYWICSDLNTSRTYRPSAWLVCSIFPWLQAFGESRQGLNQEITNK